MASLNELLDASFTVEDIVIRIQQLLRHLSTNIVTQPVTQEEMELYQFYLQRVVDRNKKMLEK
jgi:octanoyl-[GcvH]:protein N-octanoyltransferase